MSRPCSGPLRLASAFAALLWAAGCSSGSPAPAPTTIAPQVSESSALENEPSDLSTDEGAQTDEPTSDDHGPGLQPFDGGSYTWKNGVTMKTQVIRIEPWGTKDDYCGDGSCGISHPDDTRMVLRYTVSVPKSFKGTFDPSSCPGEMHVASGNDEDSFNSVAGDYHKSLDGKMLPGATKYGDNEYSIEKRPSSWTSTSRVRAEIPTTPVKLPTSEAESPRTPGSRSPTRMAHSNGGCVQPVGFAGSSIFSGVFPFMLLISAVG